MNFTNKLSYGLLGLLLTEPMSGYDLTLRLNRFWRSTHSAIYPSLAELEGKGLVEFTLKEGNGKPDKKVYSLTVQGREFLHEWFISETSEEVIRDEMILKFCCIKYMDTDAAENLLNEFETRYKRKVERLKNSIEKIRLKSYENHEDSKVSSFGAFILIQKSLNEAMLDLKWCEWVRNVYMNNDLSFLDNDFTEERYTN